MQCPQRAGLIQQLERFEVPLVLLETVSFYSGVFVLLSI